jgi:hypothetical protein
VFSAQAVVTSAANSSNRTNTDPDLIFLDTSVLKHAADRLIRGRVHRVNRRWGTTKVTADVMQYVEIYPNAAVPQHFAFELRWLPFIAHLAKVGRLHLTTHHEVLQEFWSLPETDDPRGLFYGAPVARAPDPFQYSRLLVGWGQRCPVEDIL